MLLQFGLLLMAGESFSERPRPKRIVNGEALRSPYDYDTFHFVSLTDVWSCSSEQEKHLLHDCAETFFCGGSLISPDFVMTAAHCLMYGEIILSERKEHEHESIIENIWDYLIVPKNKYAIHSNVGILAGSTDFFNMTQRRHALKIFPDYRHPQHRYQLDIAVRDHRNEYEAYPWHDVMLVQTCEPFIITETVRLAPILYPPEALFKQFEDMTETMAVCLYVGFGYTGNPQAQRSEYTQEVDTQWLQHTWQYTTCSKSCSWFHLKNRIYPPPEIARNLLHECKMCSQPHGKPSHIASGDSGGPVMCDGYYVGLILGTETNPTNLNESIDRSYPVYCTSDKITEERLEYYRSTSPDEFHHLRPEPTSSQDLYT